LSTPFPRLKFLHLAKPTLMCFDEILKKIFQDSSKNLFHTFLSFFGLNNSFNNRCKVCFYKSVVVNTSLVDYISWLVDYRGSRLTFSDYHTHVMLTIVMLCYVNHCHAIMDIIKNISDTLNQQQILVLHRWLYFAHYLYVCFRVISYIIL